MTAIVSEASDSDRVMRRAAGGDAEAFRELVEEHQAMVFSIAYRFCGDRGIAEELAQDVFVQLYRSMGDIESPEHLMFWLRRVTANRCIDKARRSRLRLVPIDKVAEPPAAVQPSDPLFARALREAMAALPEAQRLVVTLRFQEELEPSEICSLLGMPINTVKSHLQRALGALRRRFVPDRGAARDAVAPRRQS
ncbi:MAG TPA: sigma-70 family RNA polymerase sigma factor [Thermoanaerobaculia bacterium]|nr:sigma-70 family RNA polymerase sigma factor [Thermoanaerobaculia bacterium]